MLGEFPWRVKVGEKVVADDFTAPPFVLSSEITPDEITWSRGEYMPGAEIWKAFNLPGRAPAARGVYLNQPSPMGANVGGIWANFAWMLALLLGLAIFFAIFSRKETVFRSSYAFSSVQQGEPSFVTGDFDLTGRPASLEVAVNTNLDNNWTYFNFALVNEDTGQAYDFGREVSYYHGADSDGSWDEGSRDSSVSDSRGAGGAILSSRRAGDGRRATVELRSHFASRRAQLRLVLDRGRVAADSAGFLHHARAFFRNPALDE